MSATPIVISAKTDAEMRTGIAQAAICKVSGLLTALENQKSLAAGNQDQAFAFEHLWDAVVPRIKELHSAALRAMDESDDVQAAADLVYGEWLIAEEASHG